MRLVSNATADVLPVRLHVHHINPMTLDIYDSLHCRTIVTSHNERKRIMRILKFPSTFCGSFQWLNTTEHNWGRESLSNIQRW